MANTELQAMPLYTPSRTTDLLGLASAANGQGAYELVPVKVPNYEARTALEEADKAIMGDSTEHVVAEIDELIAALVANREALIESRNEQVVLRNSLVEQLKTTYEKMRAIIPKAASSFAVLEIAKQELLEAEAFLLSRQQDREKVLNEAKDPSAGLTPTEIQGAHDRAADMLRLEGPLSNEVTEKKEWLDLCAADFDIVATQVKSIFDEEEKIFTAFRLLSHDAQLDEAAKSQTAKRIGKAAVLVSRSTARDWFGRKSKRFIDGTARAITKNAGPRVTVVHDNATEEGNEA